MSDDHSWVGLASGSGPELTHHVEVASEAACGQLVPLEAQQGWLYSGGHGIRCSTQQAITVLVAALSPEDCKQAEAGKSHYRSSERH